MSIVTTMKCDCCGAIFYSEYYEGGYIDHVRNFSEQTDFLSKIDADRAVEEIVYYNDIRKKQDIKERLNCFCMQPLVSDEIKKECRERVENFLEFDKQQKELAKERASGLTDCEKHYLYNELQDNYKAPSDGGSIRKSLGF